jgi:hypothetical protein
MQYSPTNRDPDLITIKRRCIEKVAFSGNSSGSDLTEILVGLR